jgi:hypothetical protein
LARAAAKKGAIAGLVFAGMYVLGTLMLVYAGMSPTTGGASTAYQEQGVYLVIADVILTLIILFFSWRVWSGRGYISGTLMLLWFICEAVLKVLGGSANIGWIFFYFAMMLAMIEGIRGCWLGRRYRNVPSVATFD